VNIFDDFSITLLQSEKRSRYSNFNESEQWVSGLLLYMFFTCICIYTHACTHHIDRVLYILTQVAVLEEERVKIRAGGSAGSAGGASGGSVAGAGNGDGGGGSGGTPIHCAKPLPKVVQAAKKTASKEQKAQTKAAQKGLPIIAMCYLRVLRGGGGIGNCVGI